MLANVSIQRQSITPSHTEKYSSRVIPVLCSANAFIKSLILLVRLLRFLYLVCGVNDAGKGCLSPNLLSFSLVLLDDAILFSVSMIASSSFI